MVMKTSTLARFFLLGSLIAGLLVPAPSSHAQDGDAAPVLAGEAPVVGLPSHPSLRITINIPARELRVFENNTLIRQYPVAVGQPRYRSPVLSSKKITRIIWNPSWIPPPSPWAVGAKVAPPGPHNPLGPVKMPITNDILVHGTNKPASVGTAASHGCFRMHNEEAGELAWFLQQRASAQLDPSLRQKYQAQRGRTFWVTLDQSIPVDVIYEPVEVIGGALHLHPDLYGKIGDYTARIRSVLAAYGINTISDATLQSLRSKAHSGSTVVTLSEIH